MCLLRISNLCFSNENNYYELMTKSKLSWKYLSCWAGVCNPLNSPLLTDERCWYISSLASAIFSVLSIIVPIWNLMFSIILLNMVLTSSLIVLITLWGIPCTSFNLSNQSAELSVDLLITDSYPVKYNCSLSIQYNMLMHMTYLRWIFYLLVKLLH